MPTNRRAARKGEREIDQVLRQHKITPQVIVHRGHSSYADLTIAQIPGTAGVPGQLRGYSQLEAILRQAPEAHVIATKGIGGITVNDPLLKALNDYLLSGKDVIWTDFWRHAETVLAGNPGLPTMCHRTKMPVSSFSRRIAP